jgi:hypothetical protein
MKVPIELEVTINERELVLSLPVQEDELLDAVLDALTDYVRAGADLKIRQTYMTSPSDSMKMLLKLISKVSQMDEWRGEVKQLIRVLKRQAKVDV